MATNQKALRGLNLLSLDGGGITGLSSLYILREIMDRLQLEHNLATRPEPWEHFDLIAGTGTGAVTAIMLGRLKLGMDDTIRIFHQLMSDAFSAKRLVGFGPVFKETNLEEGLKRIVFDVTGDRNATLLGDSPEEAGCKVIIYAMSAHNLNAGLPCAFRTYPAILNVMPNCPIWKALRASMANPGLFRSFTIEEHGLKHEFIGGGLGCNNPTAELLKEANTLFRDQYVSCALSVGAGHAQTIHLPESSTCGILLSCGQPLSSRLLRVTQGLAEDSEKVAEDMATRFSRVNDFYFRLNVNQGMQSIKSSDWEKQSAVAGHAAAYLRSTEVGTYLARLVEVLQEKRATLMASQIDGRIDIPSPRISPLKSIFDHANLNIQDTYSDGSPPISPNSVSMRLAFCRPPIFMHKFKGRKPQLMKAIEYFGNESEMQHVFVLHGLGGAGKTQLAWKCAEIMVKRFEGVLFIDGSSHSTIEADLRKFAVAQHCGSDYKDALQWLQDRGGRWMMLFDGLDDPQISIQDYFPQADRYDVLITTRQKQVVLSHARGRDSDCKVHGMDPEEALELFLDVARLRKEALKSDEMKAATSLLEELGHLALAIVQSAAFIFEAPCTIAQYYDMYCREPRETLERDGMAALQLLQLNKYKYSVFTTWESNKPQAGTPTEGLWNLFIHMHRNGISENMFRRAFENLPSYAPDIPPNEFEAMIHRDVASVLNLFTRKDGTWSSRKFISAMGKLVSQSLVNLDEISKEYQLHPLVQRWARATAPKNNGLEKASFLLAISIDTQRHADDHAYKRAIAPHVSDLLNLHPKPNPNDAWQFAAIYRTVGDFVKAELLEEYVTLRRTEDLGPEHPSTLEATSYAAVTQHELGRLGEAEAKHTSVLAVRRRVLGDDHPNTLSSMANLAMTYCARGRLTDAELLQGQALAAQRRVLGKYHPNTLSSMASLAATYFKQGRMPEAEALEIEVLDARKQVLGEEHPNTLESMANLALIFSERGRLGDAEELGIEVLNASLRVLGEDHPNTLISKENLALTYGEQGRLADSELLEIEVLAARKRVLGEDHPGTLLSMANLAAAYFKQGRLLDAESLEIKVLAARTRVLGDDHPNTLSSMANLALTYSKQGRPADAEPLYSAVLKTRKRLLGDDHLDTLQSMANLALTYSELDRLRDAESIEAAVLGARKNILGEEHPDTLQSMANLAATYYKQNRLAEAESLEAQVLAARQRVLGENDPETLSSMANLAETYDLQGRLEEVEPLEVKVVAARKQVLGGDHPDTLLSMTNLAATYYRKGRLTDAEALEIEILDSRKRVLERDHPDTLMSITNLVNVYQRQSRWADAESLQIDLVAAKQRKLGQEHPSTLKSMQDLALTLTYSGEDRLSEAESLEAEVLAGFKRVLGRDDADTLLSMANLTRIYYKQGRMEDAESLALETLAARKRVLGETHADTIKSAQHLAIISRSKAQTTSKRLSLSSLTPWRTGPSRH